MRKKWHNERWYFSVLDVVQILTDSKDVKQYVKRLRQRDIELSSYWGTICTPFELVSKGGKKRKETTSDLEDMFRIIQSIPSPNSIYKRVTNSLIFFHTGRGISSGRV